MQSNQTEALKKVLTELCWYEEAGLGRISTCDAIHTAREALAEQPAQQEPVAFVSGYYGGKCVILPINPARIFNSNTALYTSPPAQRKPLTDEEMAKAWAVADGEHNASASVKRRITRAIEAKLKEKNT